MLFPPFSSIDQEGELSGFSVEVLNAMKAKLSMHETSEEIIILPLRRAHLVLKNQPNAVVFSMYKPQFADVEHWVGPIAFTRLQIIGREHDVLRADGTVGPITTTNWRSFGLIGVEKGSYAADLLKLKGVDKQTRLNAQTGGQITQSLIRMLMTNRIDAFAATAANVRHEASILGIEPGQLVVLEELAVGELYFGFHKSIPKARVALWQQAFDSLVADRSLQDIYRKYASSQFRIFDQATFDAANKPAGIDPALTAVPKKK